MSAGFVWGDGGQATTPDAVNTKRKLIAAALAKGKEDPIKHWTQGAAHVAEAMLGAYQMKKLDDQERGARDASSERSKSLIGALLGGDTPQPQPQPTATPEFKGDGFKPASPEMAGAFPKSLVRTESGGNWQAQNDVTGAGGMKGHFGRLQFGQARLQDAMNAGAIPQGTTPQQFMASPEMQQRAEAWHFNDIDQNIKTSGLDKAIGTTINGVPVTQDGMRAVAHLGGSGGLAKFIQTGGQYNPADANGTRLSDYLKTHAGQTGAPQTQPVQMAQAQQAAPQVSTAQIQGAMQIINDPWAKPGDKAAAQFILQKRLTAETKDPRDNRLKDLTIAEKEAGIANQAATAPLTRRQAELGIQKTERELAGEGATPLSAEERKSIGVPDGQPAYKTRSGEIKFGPAGTKIVNEAQKQETEFGKETGKALAKRFDQLATDGDEAAQSMELVAEMRRLGGRIDTGAAATVKAYLGKIGVKTEGVSDIEAFNTLVDRLTPQQRVPGSGATSDFDAKMFKGSLPSLMNTPEGNKLILDTVEKISANKIARGDVAMRVQMQELTPKQGMEEIRKLQAEAKAISDQFKPTGKPAQGTPAQPKPGEWQEVDGVRIRVKP